MAADGLVMQGLRASAAMALTYFAQNIPLSTTQPLPPQKKKN